MAVASSLAVLVGSTLTRLLAHVVLSATRTNVPTKLVPDQAEAETWLLRAGAGKVASG